MSSSAARARSRRRLLSWIPISLVALLCVGFVVAALVMQNSWWADRERPADVDQQAVDGASVFTTAGVDYLTRQGAVRVRMGGDALSATQLGLEPDGVQTVEPLTPVEAVIAAPDGVFHIDLVRAFTLTTAGDRLVSAGFVKETNGSWQSVLPYLRATAESWGWSDADLDRLQDDLTAAARDGDGEGYSARVGPVEKAGALVSVDVAVDLVGSSVTATFVIADAGD